MTKNPNISKGASTHAGNPAPRWRAVIMTLALALTLGSAGYPVHAQTQDQELYLVDVINPEPITVCVRQSRDYRVRIVSKNSIGLSSDENASMQLGAGTTFTPVVADPSIIDFTTGVTLSINSPDPGLIRPGIVVLRFKAKREGRTTITFNATVPQVGQTLKFHPYTVDVSVQECRFKVSVKSRWEVPGLSYVAVIDDTELTPDAKGNYTGTATVTWLGLWDVIPPGAPGIGAGVTCSTKLTALPSLAYLTGKLDDNGYLEVNITYLSNASSWRAICRDSSGSTPPIDTPGQLTAASLKISVPAAFGGVSSQKQELTGQIGEPDSSTFIDIYPDTSRQRP